MEKCIVKNCGSISTNLFCSPTDEKILKKWQTSLETDKNYFFVCENHFSKKDIIIEKCLEITAVPSKDILDNQYSKNENSCGICLAICKENEKVQISKQISEDFKELTGYQPVNELICDACEEFMLKYEHFKTEVKARHKNLRAQIVTSIESDDDDCVVIPEASPKTKVLPKLPSQIISKLKVINDERESRTLLGCKHCYCKATDRYSLNKHIDENHYFPCENCPFISSNNPLLTLHRNKAHLKDDPTIVCGICDEKFDDKFEIYDHYDSFHSSQVVSYFLCFYCKDNFTTETKLRDHYKQLHADGLTTAQDQINNTKLQLALLAENKEKQPDQINSKSYSALMQKIKSSLTVKKVIERKRPKKKITQRRGSFDFHLPLNTPIKISNSAEFSEYDRKTRSRPCDKITEVTIVSGKGSAAYFREGPEQYDESQSEMSSDEEMEVEICDDTICISDDEELPQKIILDNPATKKELKDLIHKTVYTKTIVIKSSESTKRSKDKTAFRCFSCNEYYDDIANLLEHREKAHPPEEKSYEILKPIEKRSHANKKYHFENDGNNKVKCDQCEAMMQEKNLKKHKDIRHSEMKFLCHICSTAFSDHTSFRYHMMKHDPQQMFQCDMCSNLGFVTKGKLRRHIVRVHLKIRQARAQCTICNQKLYKFKNGNILEYHMKKYHENGIDDGYRVNEETNYFDCEKCGASYWDLYTFKRHSCDKGRLQLRCFDCMIPCANKESLEKHKATKCKKINPFLNSSRS